MLDRRCSQRDAAPALRSLASCGSERSASPACAWTKLRVHDGGPARPGLENARHCAREAFDAFICGLPVWRGEKVLPPDWAFGAEPATVGKFVARWAMSLFLRSVAERPRRYAVPAPELTGWLWRPKGQCAAANGAEAWVRADVCRAGGRGPRELELALERSAAGQQMFREVRGNSSGRWKVGTDVHWMATAGGGVTGAGLWWAAQLVRLALEALGPCGAEAGPRVEDAACHINSRRLRSLDARRGFMCPAQPAPKTRSLHFRPAGGAIAAAPHPHSRRQRQHHPHAHRRRGAWRRRRC